MEHRRIAGSSRFVLLILLVTCAVLLGSLVASEVLAVPSSAAGDAAAGRALFTGGTRMEHGGPACISCHSVEEIGALGGGRLARDLTHVYSRFGEAGIAGALKSPMFPVMKDIFEQHPLTEQEISDLLAFFAEADTIAAESSSPSPFGWIGLGGLIVLLILAQIFWAGRNRGVRKRLVGGLTG